MIITLFIIFILLNIFDAIITYISLKNYNLREDNPILRSLFAKIGVLPGLVLFKTSVVTLIGLSYFKFGWFTEYGFTLSLAICNFIYLIVTVNNVITLMTITKGSKGN